MSPSSIDLHSLDAVVSALYSSISGPPGGRDWELSRALFHPDARQVRTRVGSDGKPVSYSFSIDDFQRDARELLAGRPFFELEIGREVVRFGNLAQVFSAYEIRDERSGPVLRRGVNLLHLFDDGDRWWIMHCIWDEERPENPIPEALLSSGDA